jgi:hypothetical protein
MDSATSAASAKVAVEAGMQTGAAFLIADHPALSSEVADTVGIHAAA